jgi:N-acetyl-anhydromuramyl-L-alanine amidase AmpD
LIPLKIGGFFPVQRDFFMHKKRMAFLPLFVLLTFSIALTQVIAFHSEQSARAAGPQLESAFQHAAQEFTVPEDLLKAICQETSHISIDINQSTVDGVYGCGLVKQLPGTLDSSAYGGPFSQDVKKHAGVSKIAAKHTYVDTLDQASNKLSVTPQVLQEDLATNIRGTAYILSADAQQLSPTHQLPTTIEGWHAVVEVFSNAPTRFAAHLYASHVYTLLQSGFSTSTNSGEVIVVKAQSISANAMAIDSTNDPAFVASLPVGCTNDGKTDYPGAVDCILDPALHDCDLVPGDNAPCSYFSSAHYSPTYRQNDGTITHVVIHDSEASSALAVINFFANPASNTSAHYIVDTNGTVYQILHEKDVAFQAGNLWYNNHSVGIEHAGFDATGFRYYNSVEYKASARLTAYLVQKYTIPLNHDHIVSHGTIPSPNLANTPNHVDPGPYWLWSYYLQLIRGQVRQDVQLIGVESKNTHIITLRPPTDVHPALPNGTETTANFNFFYLYSGPSTKSGLIPQQGMAADITDETNNVEPAVSYYYIDKAVDPAGTGYTLYEIWYGEADQVQASPPTFFANAKLAWLAVPPKTANQGKGIAVTLKSSDGTPVQVSGSPRTNVTGTDFHIGDAPNGSIFVSSYKVTEDGTTNIWYEINYNHRQAWVPASSVVVAP